MAGKAPEDEPKKYAKRDALLAIEKEMQQVWEDEHLFESDADADAEGSTDEKYFCTFPYPYMNGRLHLGHTFSLTKVEFAAQYHRVRGKRVLFPFAFHCTGMPIKACADKLKREMQDFGNPPVFPAREGDETSAAAAGGDDVEVDPTKFVAKKAKAGQKAGAGKYQWEIMASNGVPDSETAEFADAAHWLDYFPPHCIDDMKKLGVGVDWRRSFITTDTNPYYDSFIRWQFTLLKERNKIKFGKRYSIYSPKDGQPCMDHDRSKGEGIGPQEYTLVKLELVKPFPEPIKDLESQRVFLVAGTLRPETMYGQTNCWVLPSGKYGVFSTNVEGEAFVCTERAARNMAFQGLSKEEGKVDKIGSIQGSELLGHPLKAPLAPYEKVYTLPMNTISMNKGTGIVTSVPSDSPDDYINLEVLKRKADYRAKYGLTDEMVLPFDVVSIIHCPTLGDVCAQTACEQYKVESPNQRIELDKAKEDCYKEGFYQGVMKVGESKGKPVSEAKNETRDRMIANGQAVKYAEPNGTVVSRSGDDCVVALVDQWYLDYGEPTWQKQVIDHLSDMEFYSPETRTRFDAAIDWLHEWACSRTYGLGTRLPWDEEYLIDSLSDSTIYMAFYTIAHFLQGDIKGTTPAKEGIKPEQMTRAVWDFIYQDGEYPADCGIPEATLLKMRKEFEYWYPVDLRVSGKDLIQNHLVFFMYNHLAIWDAKRAPLSIRANGHVMLNEAKMSKSEGNFLTLSDGVDQYTADGMRLALADGGDSIEDANFSTKNSNAAILRLFTLLEWVTEVLEACDKDAAEPGSSDVVETRADAEWTFLDRAFDAHINEAIRATEVAYEGAQFREAIQSGVYGIQAHRDAYRLHTTAAGQKMNSALVKKFVAAQMVLLAPITPHLSEYVWRKLLKRDGSVLSNSWMGADEPDAVVLQQDAYLLDSLADFRKKKDMAMKPKKGKKPGPLSKVTVIIASAFPEWMSAVLGILKEAHEGADKPKPVKELLPQFQKNDAIKRVMKKAMPFIAAKLREFDASKSLKTFSDEVPFDETAFVKELAPVFANILDVKDVEVRAAKEGSEMDRCRPLTPLCLLE
jgi:leucyl-tRNA synthetase